MLILMMIFTINFHAGVPMIGLMVVTEIHWRSFDIFGYLVNLYLDPMPLVGKNTITTLDKKNSI